LWVLFDLTEDFNSINSGHTDVQQQEITGTWHTVGALTFLEQEGQRFLSIFEEQHIIGNTCSSQILHDERCVSLIIFGYK